MNCVFVGNSAQQGGVMGVFGRSVTLTNSTMVANRSSFGRTIASYDDGNKCAVNLDNCIIWNGGDEFYKPNNSVFTLNSCDVSIEWDGPGAGNFSSDPLFVRTPNDGGDGWGDDPSTSEIGDPSNDDFGDLRLRFGSPCLDAGNTVAVLPDTADLDGDGNLSEPTPVDLAGVNRFVDIPGIPGVIDMGAYEFQSIPGDLNHDWVVNLIDLGRLSEVWKRTDCGPANENCGGADLDRDGDVDLKDGCIFANHWLEGAVSP